MNPKLILVLMGLCAPCWAQQAPAPAASAPSVVAAESSRSAEPDVKRTVIEDDGARIEELRVRGETQRIVVTPKVGLHKSYEIMTGDDLLFQARDRARLYEVSTEARKTLLQQLLSGLGATSQKAADAFAAKLAAL